MHNAFHMCYKTAICIIAVCLSVNPSLTKYSRKNLSICIFTFLVQMTIYFIYYKMCVEKINIYL